MSEELPALNMHCPGCDLLFTSKDEAKRHICLQKKSSPSVFHCRSCRMLFHDKSQLSAHLQSHGVRDNFQKAALSCWVCGKTLPDSWSFKRHMGVHKISNYRAPMPVNMNPPEVQQEMTPRCRLCGVEVQKDGFCEHSAQHFTEIFEVIRPKPDEPGKCSQCRNRQNMLKGVLEMLEGRLALALSYLRKVTGTTASKESR